MAKTLDATSNIASTGDFIGVRVVSHGKKNDKRVGKVYRFVFHPTERRVVGFNVKRPDLLLMFHRKDSFVALDGYHVEDGRIMIDDDPAASGQAAIKRLNLDWDNCVLWLGMPIVTMSGEKLGYVGDVVFDTVTGKVQSCTVDSGIANDAINGKVSIPANMIKGFKHGVGSELAPIGDYLEDGEETEIGAIVVSDEAEYLQAEGGAAAVAGEAVAVASDKARKAVDDMKPAMQDAKKSAGEAVDKGVHAVGVQLGRSKTMFSDFKKEFEEASGTSLPQRRAASSLEASNAEDSAKPASSKNVSAEDGIVEELEEASDAADTAAKPAAAKPAASAASNPLAKPSAKPSPKPQTASSAKPSLKKSKPPEITAESTARAIGKQLGRASGMFAAFKEEYDKARKDG